MIAEDGRGDETQQRFADPESEEGKKLIEDIIKAGGADVVIDFGATTSGFEACGFSD